eukprot:9546715-Alexandrium_andersonii.AAC.1
MPWPRPRSAPTTPSPTAPWTWAKTRLGQVEGRIAKWAPDEAFAGAKQVGVAEAWWSMAARLESS